MGPRRAMTHSVTLAAFLPDTSTIPMESSSKRQLRGCKTNHSLFLSLNILQLNRDSNRYIVINGTNVNLQLALAKRRGISSETNSI